MGKLEPKEMTFDQYLKSHFSKADYDNLHLKLGISKNKFTRLLNNPCDMTHAQLLKLEPLLPANSDLMYLMNAFELGLDGLSAREYLLLQ